MIPKLIKIYQLIDLIEQKKINIREKNYQKKIVNMIYKNYKINEEILILAQSEQ